MLQKSTHILTITLLAWGIPLYGQGTFEEQAYKDLKSKSYGNSIRNLYAAYSLENSTLESAEILAQLGITHFKVQRYQKACYFLKKALSKNQNPTQHITYIKSLLALEKLKEAEEEIDTYKSTYGTDSIIMTLDQKVFLNRTWKKLPNQYIVTRQEYLSSPESDFSPMLTDHTLYFTSMRNNVSGSKIDPRTGHSYADIFRSYLFKIENQTLSEAKFSTPLPIENTNTPDHEGTISIDSSEQKVFYSRCKSGRRGTILCNIYQADVENGHWVNHHALFPPDTNVVYSHPFVSQDGLTVYFTSNMDSRDHLDIYTISYNDFSKKWSLPKRLRNGINTSGNECFPTLDHQGNLYFASDGLLGMGGLDLFKAEKNGYGFGTPENLKPPINSGSDDFGITWNAKGDAGLFSSDRIEGEGSDDLYTFQKIPYKILLNGSVEDRIFGIPLEGVQITIYGSDGSVQNTITDLRGKYYFQQIEPRISYKIRLHLEKYLSQNTDFSTVGIPPSYYEFKENGFVYTIDMPLKMNRMISPVLLRNILYDFNSAKLKPESKKSLNQLKDLLEENPKIVIQLRSHTDHIGSTGDNLGLSKRRAQSCIFYLKKLGIDSMRLRAVGLGEREPYRIPYKSEAPFAPERLLTERFINTLDSSANITARSLNRRTDFKIIGLLEFHPSKKGTKTFSVRPLQRASFRIHPNLLYTLGAQENYGTVAKRFGLTVRELKKINEGLKGIRPFKGLPLKVSRSHDYRKFDAMYKRLSRREVTISHILKKFDLDLKTFQDLNPELRTESLRGGILVKVKS